MGQFVIRRLIYSVAVVVGVSVVVFFITRLLGDPARMMMPLESTEEEVQAFREAMGFNDPILEQFGRFAVKAVQGDFGDSLWQREPALGLVVERLPKTFQLVLISTAMALAISIPLGVMAALRPRSLLDRLCTVGSLTGVSIPDFWLGLILIIVFAVQLRLFYTSGTGTWRHIVLPALTLAARPVGRITLITRSAMIDELSQQYMMTARAKGLRERVVVVQHALRNALIPIITLSAWQIARLVAGLTVAVETVFAWPGIGLLAIQAIKQRDLPLLQADVFVVALLVTLLMLVMDILYAVFDPRIRYT
jgi:peptide/nickel transport system permease protein